MVGHHSAKCVKTHNSSSFFLYFLSLWKTKLENDHQLIGNAV